MVPSTTAHITLPGSRSSQETPAKAAAHSDSKEKSFRPHLNPRANIVGVGDLFCLSDAVPYLLGPDRYIDSLAEIHSDGIPTPPAATFNGPDGMIVDPGILTPLDQALFFALALLKAPEDQKVPHAAELERFEKSGSRLLVFKDYGTAQAPRLDTVDVDGFLPLAAAWAKLPNPALVAGDGPNVVTPWAAIARRIRKAGHRIQDVRESEYYELTQTTGKQLDSRIKRLGYDIEDRKRREEARIVAATTITPPNNTFWYTMPLPANRNKLYVKRFSHKYPRGYLVDYNQEYRDHQAYLREKEREKAAEVPIKKREEWERMQRKCKQVTKWTTLLIVMAGLVVVLYFKVGRRSGMRLNYR